MKAPHGTDCVTSSKTELTLDPKNVTAGRLQLNAFVMFLLPAAPSQLVAALFRFIFCVRRLGKTAGPPLLKMELWINNPLMVCGTNPNMIFFSHVTKHFHSS